MLNKTRAIVLHHVRYGETSIVITLYTEKFGRLACMASGIRSRKTRIPAILFQPLTIVDTDFYYRQNREIQRMKEASCPVIYNSIPFNYTKSAIALFLSEVLYLSLREEESNPVLFSFLIHSLQLLDTLEEGSVFFHHWFLLHLTRYLGYFPEVHQFDGPELFSSGIHSFGSLSAGASRALRRIGVHAQGPPDLSDITYRERNELLEGIIRYYSLHIDGFMRLKSLMVLQEVFKTSPGDIRQKG